MLNAELADYIVTEVDNIFLVVSLRPGRSLPFYATERGFLQFNPFLERSFKELLLRFDSKEAADAFVKQHCIAEPHATSEEADFSLKEELALIPVDHAKQVEGFTRNTTPKSAMGIS